MLKQYVCNRTIQFQVTQQQYLRITLNEGTLIELDEEDLSYFNWCGKSFTLEWKLTTVDFEKMIKDEIVKELIPLVPSISIYDIDEKIISLEDEIKFLKKLREDMLK